MHVSLLLHIFALCCHLTLPLIHQNGFLVAVLVLLTLVGGEPMDLPALAAAPGPVDMSTEEGAELPPVVGLYLDC